MTKREFNNKFPDGLNKVIYLFEMTLWDIMNGEEIDRVIARTKGREKRHLKAFKASYRKNVKSWDSAPIWLSLVAIDSLELMKDIITIMVMKDGKIFPEDIYKGNFEDENV